MTMTMTEGTRRDPASVLERLSEHWGWLLLLGVITVVAGIAALAWPGLTLLVVAVLFGAQLIVMGIFRFVSAFASDDVTGGNRVLLALLGVLSLFIGLYAVRHVLISLLALALLLGIYWIISGTMELYMALAHRGLKNRGWTGVMGVLGVLAGLIVLVYPAISLLTLAIVLGIWLIVRGVMEVSLAFNARSLHHRAI
ncbi:MAG TPA: HdeD family acid-resistance protein [Trebonia sp.]|jgi:uncharacterized membrane protein HdeD (DUF308 family)|nr:HdeD family acid-resistance protein [Trebonia sp.]